VLVVGAGGGGSADLGGGGGGGQVVDSSNTAVSGNVTISVGAGGAAGYNRVGNATNGGRTGSSSSVVSSGGTVTAKGGSGATGRSGADNKNADGTANNTGYTGGGGAYAGTGGSTGTGGALYKGGDGGGAQGGGGGGGAGGVGQARSGNANGGDGVSSNITGAAVFYGGGGGGGTYTLTVGAGGNGGGGAGGRISANGTSGTDGLGGGGGGAASAASNSGGKGGSGVVIVRYSIPVVPSNSGAPVVSGTAATGSTLTTSNGTWSGPPTSYAYQWKRSATSTGEYENITTATSSSYVVSEFDVGYFIKVSVTGTNGLGSASATSAATTAVVDIAPTNTALPVVSGTARNGATLSTTDGSWTSSPSSFAYQWKRSATSTADGTYNDITSATSPTYVANESDVGYFIKVSVTATNNIGSSTAATSAATSAVVDIAPTNTAIPVITGTARNGATLSTTDGSWTSSPSSFAYQWQRASSVGGTYNDITSATSPTYEADESDVGYFIKVSVTATNGLGSASATSAATSAVVDIAPTNTAIPVITGTARTGATLTTTNGSWTSAPSSSTTYTYQWKRAGSVGGTYNNITSATDKTYELTDTDIDKFIKVSVIARNSIGPSSAVLSAATSVVIDLTDSVVPTATTPVATATGFTFTISNHSPSYTYALTTSKGTVSRSNDDVTVTGLAAGESATVTIAVTRTNYKPASKTVTGSATPATTTTTLKPDVVIDIQAPVTTVAQGQLSVATIAPSPTPVTTVAQGQASVATIAPSVSQSTTPPTNTTTSTTTLAPEVTPRVKNAAIPTESPSEPETTPRVKNAAIPTVQPLAPMIAEVSTGESALDVGGVRTKVDVSRANNQIVLQSGTYQAVLSGLDADGTTRSLDADGNLRLAGGDVLRINMGGFKVETQIDVWMFSTPVLLGTAEVGADGRVTGTFTIPKSIEDGSHRIAVTAKLPNGKPTTFTLGILVGDIATTSTLTRVLIAIPITLAVGFGFLLPNQLRRRRKARPA
jgi:hypothetical protein